MLSKPQLMAISETYSELSSKRMAAFLMRERDFPPEKETRVENRNVPENAEKTQKKRNSCPARQIHQHGSHHAAGKQKQIERVRGEYSAVGAGGTDECDACKKLKGHCQNQRQIKEMRV